MQHLDMIPFISIYTEQFPTDMTQFKHLTPDLEWTKSTVALTSMG